MFSAGQSGIAQDLRMSPSTPTSPNSLTNDGQTLALRVLHQVADQSGFASAKEAGDDGDGKFCEISHIQELLWQVQWGDSGNAVLAEMFGAFAPWHKPVSGIVVAGHAIRDGFDLCFGVKVAVDIGVAVAPRIMMLHPPWQLVKHSTARTVMCAGRSSLSIARYSRLPGRSASSSIGLAPFCTWYTPAVPLGLELLSVISQPLLVAGKSRAIRNPVRTGARMPGTPRPVHITSLLAGLPACGCESRFDAGSRGAPDLPGRFGQWCGATSPVTVAGAAALRASLRTNNRLSHSLFTWI